MTLYRRVVTRLVQRFTRNKQWRLLHVLLVVTRKDMGYLNARAKASAAAMPKLHALWTARERDEVSIRGALQDEKIALI